MKDASQQLRDRTKKFALRILKAYKTLPNSAEIQVLGKQLIRSGTSVAANYRAACRARSRAEFVARVSVVAEEADESVLWLELLAESGYVKPDRVSDLLKESKELAAIFTASEHTARQNGGKRL